MFDYKLNTPVAFLIFKRPDVTAQVFETIRQVKPPKLLVVADGPRRDREGEAELCDQTRSIIDKVDWDCEVLTNYSSENLGCKKRVSSGLDWVFDTVEEAIILEDDCLPDLTFYPFAEDLLARYRDDTRVFSITGNNVQFGRKRTDYSYYFSRYTHCWSWASWRRAWKYFDVEMKLWPEIRDSNFLSDILGDPQTVKVWNQTLEMCYEGKLNSWAFIWTFTSFIHNGLNAISQRNLVQNIGHGIGSTHTDDVNSPYNNMAREQIEFPLKHPPFLIRDSLADQFTQDTFYDYAPSLCQRIYRKLTGSSLKKRINSRLKRDY
jgi:hypothetical protein